MQGPRLKNLEKIKSHPMEIINSSNEAEGSTKDEYERKTCIWSIIFKMAAIKGQNQKWGHKT